MLIFVRIRVLPKVAIKVAGPDICLELEDIAGQLIELAYFNWNERATELISIVVSNASKDIIRKAGEIRPSVLYLINLAQ